MSKRLDSLDAAHAIYNRNAIEGEDILQVEKWLQRGVLRGEKRGGDWFTTEEDVADFMARRAAAIRRKKWEKRRKNGPQHLPAATFACLQANFDDIDRKKDDLADSYRSVLKDYFLAVIRRRNLRHASRSWKYSVLLGQAAFIAAAVLLLFWSFGFNQQDSPEHRAIRSWVAAKHPEDHGVRDIEPLAEQSRDDETVFSVKYYYRSKNRGRVHTEQYFVYKNHQIVDVKSDL